MTLKMTSLTYNKGEEPAHPVDKGWAWVILAGCTINFGLIVGTMKSFGIYFIEFISIYQAGVSMTSLIAGLLQAFYSLASLPIMTILLYRLSSRQIVILGGLFGTIAYMTGSYAPNITFLLFSNGILYGIAFGCVHGPCSYLIGLYFVRRRSLANAIVVAGGSFGGLLLPPIYRALLDTYDLRGALLITAGIIFHTQVGAALMRPPSFYRIVKRQQSYKEKTNATDNDQCRDLLAEERPKCNDPLNGFSKDSINKNSNISLNVDIPPNYNHTNQMLRNKCTEDVFTATSSDSIHHSHMLAVKILKEQELHGSNRSVVNRKIKNDIYGSHTSFLDKLSASNFSVYASHGDLYTSSLLEVSQQQADADVQSPVKHSDQKECCFRPFSIDISILKNSNMSLFLIVYCLGSVGSAYGHIYIPAYARDKGIDDSKISYMVSTISGCDFAGRILCGVLVDRNIMKNTNLVIGTLLIAGIFMEFSYFYEDFWAFMMFSVVHGLFAGGIFALTPAILADMLGMENFRSSQGLCIFGQGFTMGSSAPFIGYLRDVTGDYNASFQFMGACLIVSAFTLLAQPWIERVFNARKENSLHKTQK